MAVARKALMRHTNLDIWLLVSLVVLSVGGFAGYYYYDRYVHTDEKLVERETEHVEEMILQNPQNANLRISVGAYYLDAGQTDAAIEQAREAMKLKPDFQAALILLGRGYLAKGDSDKAITSFERVVELNKDNPMAKVDKSLQRVYFELGRLYSQQGRYTQAAEVLTMAVTIDRTDADARQALGLVYQKQGDHTAAVKEFQEGLRFDPFFGDAYQALSVSYAALGQTTQASYAQAMVGFSQGKYDEAASRLQALVKQSPEQTQIYLGLGLIYEKMKKHDQAADAMQEYLRAYPNDIAARQLLGRLNREAQR